MLPHWLIQILSQRIVADAYTRCDKAAFAYFVAAIRRTNSHRFVEATCRGDVSQRFVASCVSAFKLNACVQCMINEFDFYKLSF